MTGQHFDDLTKSLGRSGTRRSVLKGLAATVLGGMLTRVDRRAASAATSRPACRRLHETCSSSSVCCAGNGTCNSGVCCVATNGRCSDDSDCCEGSGNVCRPAHPGDVLQVCLPPAPALGACAESSDCAEALVCAPGLPVAFLSVAPVVSDDLVCIECVDCWGYCTDDRQCCSGYCDLYCNKCIELKNVT